MNDRPPLQFASAASDAADTTDAIAEIVNQIEHQFELQDIDLLMVFVTPAHAAKFEFIIESLRRELAPRYTLALTAESVIGAGRELERTSAVTALAARMPGVWIKPFESEDIEQPRDEKGLARLTRLFMHDDQMPAAILMLADPFTTPMIHLLQFLNEAIPDVPIIGGMASAGANAGENYLALNETIHRSGAVGLAIGGDVDIQCTVSQGCRPIGKPWIITKAQHNVIHELGGRPAMSVIQETLEQLPVHERQLVQRGVFVGRVTNEYKHHFGRGDFLIRNIVGYDPNTGSIGISDLVRTGQTVQLHVRDHRTAEEDLRMLLDGQKLHGPPAGAFLATCNGRGTHLFRQPDQETKIIFDELGVVPMAGFFAAGEIGPIMAQNHLHGFTASLAVFRQRP